MPILDDEQLREIWKGSGRHCAANDSGTAPNASRAIRGIHSPPQSARSRQLCVGRGHLRLRDSAGRRAGACRLCAANDSTPRCRARAGERASEKVREGSQIHPPARTPTGERAESQTQLAILDYQIAARVSIDHGHSGRSPRIAALNRLDALVRPSFIERSGLGRSIT